MTQDDATLSAASRGSVSVERNEMFKRKETTTTTRAFSQPPDFNYGDMKSRPLRRPPCEHRWIPVTERLPEPDTFAIVATKDGVCEALYGLGGIESPNDPPYWSVNDYGEVWPTHWMPLPEPPTDGK